MSWKSHGKSLLKKSGHLDFKTVFWRTLYKDMTIAEDQLEDGEEDGLKISQNGPD